jgi:DNA-binding LacI/PurR family transcriptional regulator
VLLMIQDESDREGVERLLLRGNTDGVLLLSTRRDDPLPGRLVTARIPCVMAGHPGNRPDASAIGFVDADNVGGARRACAHLIKRGCRAIATVAGPLDMAPGVDRLAGWRQALGEARRPASPSLVAEGDFGRAGAAAGVRQLLERHPEVDGIFAASDLMALGTLDALRAAGRRVPDDVALVGFDDSELAADSDPPLTTVRQPIEALGAEMGRLLLDQLGGASPRGVTLETELVVRRSA